MNLRDILQYACNGCNLWRAKKGLPTFYFRQPLGNPTYSSPNLATLVSLILFSVPNLPGEVSVISRTETSLEVEWEAPQDATTVFTGYNVYVDGKLHGKVNNDVRRRTVDGRTANTEYEITVRTESRHTVLGVDKNQESNNRTVTEWTCELQYHENLQNILYYF